MGANLRLPPGGYSVIIIIITQSIARIL